MSLGPVQQREKLDPKRYTFRWSEVDVSSPTLVLCVVTVQQLMQGPGCNRKFPFRSDPFLSIQSLPVEVCAAERSVKDTISFPQTAD